MAYIGKVPTAVPLTSADIADSIITSAKIVDGTIALADLSATGTQDATTFLRGDNTFAAAGGGKILQVVTGTKTTGFASTSSSFVATGLSVSITPSATSSKIFIQASTYADSNAGGTESYFTIYRDATDLGNGLSGLLGIYTVDRLRSNASMSILDSPNTTSAITYEVYMRNSQYSKLQVNAEISTNSITAFEVVI